MRTKKIQCSNLKKTYLFPYLERDKKHPLNLKYSAVQNFKGTTLITSKDKKFLISIPILLIASLSLFLYSIIDNYNLNRFLYPQDFRGDFCGKNHLIDKKFIYWPDSVNWGFRVKTCLEKCPEKSREEKCLYDPLNLKYYEDYCFLTVSSFVSLLEKKLFLLSEGF